MRYARYAMWHTVRNQQEMISRDWLLFLITLVICCDRALCRELTIIPIYVRGVGGVDPTRAELNFNDAQNPIKYIRRFCGGYGIWRESCVQLWMNALYHLANNGEDVTGPVGSYEDDTIIVTDVGLTLQSALIWGSTEFKIDLSQLSGLHSSSLLLVRDGGAAIESSVRAFCVDHNLCGQMCESLLFEVTNYYTCLHSRPGGASLQNLFGGMHYQEDVDNFYFPVDVLDPTSNATGRVYFHSIATYYSLKASQLCERLAFTRPVCAKVFQYVQLAAARFRPAGTEDELLTSVYVYYVLDHLVRQRLLLTSSPEVAVEDKEAASVQSRLNSFENSRGALASAADPTADQVVDMDFIEIGTSNFNTISQMLDPTDPASVRGLAVEPSAAYLAQLPTHPGVTKVNAAIVTEAEVAGSSNDGGATTVDFYYIPEEIIIEKDLGPFLKGCNAIGDFHLMHKRASVTQYVHTAKVPALTIRQLLGEHRVRRIRLLKIDAEGYDLTILRELYLYLVARQDPMLYPERILFESNDKARAEKLHACLAEFTSLGYRVVFSGDDTIMEYLT